MNLGAREAGVQVIGEALGLRRRNEAGIRRERHQLRRAQAFQLGLRRQTEMLVQPCIRDHDAAAGIEHAQTVRHVVQRSIEPLGEQRHVARGDDRFEQGEAQTLGDQLHREEEENEQSGEDPVIDVAMKHQRGGHRQPGAHDLHDDRARAAEVASEDADHIGDGDRKADQVGDRVVGSGECDVAPDAEQPDRRRGPGDIAPLPAPRDRVALHRGARPRVGAHHQPARAGDRHEGDRTDEEQRLSGLPERGEDRCRPRRRCR